MREDDLLREISEFQNPHEFQHPNKFLQFSKKERGYFLNSPLGKAFLELEEKGFLISMHWAGTGLEEDAEDGIESIAVDKPYIFINGYDFMWLLESGNTYFHYGGSLTAQNNNSCPVCNKELIKLQITDEGEVLNCDLKFEIRENILRDFTSANNPESGVNKKLVLDKWQKAICLEHDLPEDQTGHLIVKTLSRYGIKSSISLGTLIDFELEPYYINYFSCFDLIFKRCISGSTSVEQDLILMFLGSYINEDQLISLVFKNRKLAESKIYYLFNNLFNKDFKDFYLFFKDLLIQEDWSIFDNESFNYSEIPSDEKSVFIDEEAEWEQAYLCIMDFFDEESIKERISILLNTDVKDIKFLMSENVLSSDDSFRKAKYYSEEGEESTAIRHINRAIKLDPNNISKLLFRCELNFVRNPQNTLEDLNKLEKLGCQSNKLFKLKAKCYKVLEDYESALKAYNDGIKKSPDNLNLYLDRAELRCFFLESEYEEVINDCRFLHEYSSKNSVEFPRKSAIDRCLLIAKSNV